MKIEIRNARKRFSTDIYKSRRSAFVKLIGSNSINFLEPSEAKDKYNTITQQ